MSAITYDLVVIGNPQYDRFRSPLVEPKERILSGPAANIFRVASQLGIEQAVLVGCLGDDFRSQFIEDLSGYPFTESLLLPSGTTGGFEVEYGDDGSESYSVLELAERIRIRDFPTEFFNSRLILLAPSHKEIDVEFIEWLSGSTGARLILDQRGLLQTTGNGGKIELRPDKDLMDDVVDLVHHIQTNESEAKALTGQSDPFVAAEMIVERGCDTAVITMGERGSILYDGSDFVIIPGFESAAKDCTIAGDAFLAAYALHMLKGHNHVDSGVFATCTASVLIERETHKISVDLEEIMRRSEFLLESVEFR
ncbi:MAG: carbohydrate kinase family protein [Candidatus Thorarchaeota archaeon]|jgi:sugar/nucleoside kinase (ribokinase family)